MYFEDWMDSPDYYLKPFEEYIERLKEEKRAEAVKKIEKYFNIIDKTHTLCDKISAALQDEKDWAWNLCFEDISLEEMEITALKDDSDELAYLVKYDNEENIIESMSDFI